MSEQYICKYCEREFKNGKSMGGHMSKCWKNPGFNPKHKQRGTISNCPHCGLRLEDHKSAGNHVASCKLNPNYGATMKKMSEGRLKFLEANPDKVPWLLNHSSKISWPEEVFRNALISSGITGWFYNYRNGIYQYDFAFPELKIDVEIDGKQHLKEKAIVADARRDTFSVLKGWKVIRFSAKRVKSNVIECIEELKKELK